MSLFLAVFLTAVWSSCRQEPEEPALVTAGRRMELERTGNVVMEKFIDKLVREMTIPEKIGQMIQLSTAATVIKRCDANNPALVSYSEKWAVDTARLGELYRNYHIGSFLQGPTVKADEWAHLVRILQEVNMNNSRTGIPVIFGIDLIHGTNPIESGTIFPHNINLAATFNRQMNHDAASITALESAALGMHWVFNPELDLGHNFEWGRIYETYGEDPYLCSVMGSIYVKALQENPDTRPYRQAACARHYMGYSDPRSGMDRTPAEIPSQKLHEFFRPPFEAAIDSGLMSVMICSGEVGGTPVHMSREILTGILRDDLGFTGVALTDWEDITRLVEMHRTTPSRKEATFLVIDAGADVYMSAKRTDFCDYMKELVRERRISEDRIDLSLRRILRMKYMIGLFDHPFPPEEKFCEPGNPDHRKRNLEIAGESVVLMKNRDGFLPIQNPGDILMTGPFVNLRHPLCGGWTITWHGDAEALYPKDMMTPYQAMADEFGKNSVDTANMWNIDEKAPACDVIVFIGGEHAYPEIDGDRPENTLDLSQQALLDAALNTGKPVVLIIVSGRPRVIPSRLYRGCMAMIFAGLPGKEGARAMAEVLSGKVNPSGRLTMSYPFHSAYHLPYNYKHSEDWERRSVKMKPYLMPFGAGLSYADFTYGNIHLSDTVVGPGGQITARVRVTNTGKYAGKEAVLWFIRDEYGMITRPVRELRYFEKAELQPGESKEFKFVIRPRTDLSYPDEDGRMILEEGAFTVFAGGRSAGFRLK